MLFFESKYAAVKPAGPAPMTPTVDFISSDPIPACKIPNIPNLHAQAHSAGDDHHCNSESAHRQWREAKLPQKVQKSEHDQGMNAEFVAKHALHIERSHARDGDIIDDRRAEIDADSCAHVGVTANGGNQFNDSYCHQE